jgi:hypothetical protein
MTPREQTTPRAIPDPVPRSRPRAGETPLAGDR